MAAGLFNRCPSAAYGDQLMLDLESKLTLAASGVQPDPEPLSDLADVLVEPAQGGYICATTTQGSTWQGRNVLGGRDPDHAAKVCLLYHAKQ